MGEREPSHELFAKLTNFYSRPFKGRCCKLLLWTTFVISTIVDNQRSDNFRFPCEQPLSPTSLQIWPLRFCKQVIWNDKCLWRKIPRAGRTGQTGRTGQKGRPGRLGRRRIRRTFELDFASNLCRVAFAILVMFFTVVSLLGIFGHIWHIWVHILARAIWSSGVSLKRSCKMQFRRVGLRSIGPSSQKLWPNQIFGRFPHCNYNVKLKMARQMSFMGL